jgi:recombination protein RecR
MFSADLQNLIDRLAKLPGLGPRSGRRVALHLLKNRGDKLNPLVDALKNAADKLTDCDACGNLDTHNPCTICLDPKRSHTTLCVVEGVADLWAMERSGCYRGHYHILGGTLSALEGIRPEDLRIHSLITRIQQNRVEEVILALNATVDGQTTAHYIMDQLDHLSVDVTALAQGVPLGGELDYLDDGTLLTAMNSRRKMGR